MKKVLLMLLAISLVAGLVFIVGCSDDDDDNPPTGPVVGDPDDPEFVMVSDLIGEGFLDHDGIILNLSFILVTSIPSKSDNPHLFKSLGIAQEIDSLDFSYSYSEFWHIFDVYARMVEGDIEPTDTMIYVGTDSLRFRNSEGPLPNQENSTALDIRAHFDAELTFVDAYALITTDAEFDLAQVGLFTVVVDGVTTDSLFAIFEDADTLCEVSMSSTQMATALEINDNSIYDCPVGGSIDVNAGVDISCVSDTSSFDFISTWNVVAVFNDGTITMTYTNGNTVWTITEQCDTDKKKTGMAAAIRRLGDRL